MIFTDFHEICSDFLGVSWKKLHLLEISRFQFNFSMIIPEIHLIFDLIFDLILFNFRFNFHIGTTPAYHTAMKLVGGSPPTNQPPSSSLWATAKIHFSLRKCMFSLRRCMFFSPTMHVFSLASKKPWHNLGCRSGFPTLVNLNKGCLRFRSSG